MEEAAPPDDLVLRQARIDAARRILASIHVARRLARREGRRDVLEWVGITIGFSALIAVTVVANTWLANRYHTTYLGMLDAYSSWTLLHGMGFITGGLALLVVLILIIPEGIGRVKPFRDAQRRRARLTEIEAELLTRGHVCVAIEPAAHAPRHADDLRALAHEHPDLELDLQGRCLRPRVELADWTCPSCAAPLEMRGAGMKTCGHCGYERFEALRAPTDAFSTAKAALEKLVGVSGDETVASPLVVRDRKALWQRFQRTGDEDLSAPARALPVFTLVLVGASELAGWLGIGFLAGGARALAWLVGVATAGLVPFAVYQAIRRWREFQPGVATYDAALADDIVTVLALRGEATFEEMATHLGVSKTHVMEVVAALDARAGLPLYVDHRGERLISLHARAIDDHGCPACGADLRVAPRARLRCEHCGGSFLGAVQG